MSFFGAAAYAKVKADLRWIASQHDVMIERPEELTALLLAAVYAFLAARPRPN